MGICYLRHLFYVQISIGKYCQGIKKKHALKNCTIFLCRTKWIELKGTRYSVGCIVLNSSPTFGLLIDILLTDVDEHLFVCEALKLERYAEHLHVVVRWADASYTFMYLHVDVYFLVYGA